MKKIHITASLLLLIFMFASCGSSNAAVKRLQQTEEGVSSPTTIDEYKEAIAKYEKRVADITLANEQIGIWYKILGSRYIGRSAFVLSKGDRILS